MSTPKPQPPASLAQAQQPPLPSASASAGLTQLEQQLLEEYTKLLQNLHRLSAVSAQLADQPSAEIMDSLRMLERKTGLVFTLFKASVYSMVLQQQMDTELLGHHDGGGGDGDGYAG